MRVINVIEEGKVGGPQVYLVAVAAALVPIVESTVVFPRENSREMQELCVSRRLPYRRMYLTRVTKEMLPALLYILSTPIEIIRLASCFRKSGSDLIYSSGGAWQIKGVLAARLAKKKSLWHLNDTLMPGFVLRIFGMLSHFADGYIYASERSRDYYLPLVRGDKPSFVIPAPVDTNKFDPRQIISGDEALVQKWKGKLVVGTTANINPVKGLETLVRMAAALNEKLDDLIFVCIGPVFKNQRRYYDKLVRLCDELDVSNIEFVGARADVRPILKRVDVYLCTSMAESSPISVWEAMAMSKPVVSTDVGDVPVYVKNGENGYVAKVGDYKTLADRVESLAEDEEKRVAFGKNARYTAVNKLDVKICAERHLEAFRAMLVDA